MPHAGYDYSGPAMARVASHIRGRNYTRIIIIGPSHYHSMDDQAAVWNVDGIRTPLGIASVDKTAVTQLLAHSELGEFPEIHPNEHSVQIELPWLQTVLPGIPIVPIVLGQLSPDGLSRFTEILKEIITPTTLVVISSDFTHYGNRYQYIPFTTDIPTNIRKLDHMALTAITANDRWAFQTMIKKTGATICGERPIQLLLSLLPRKSTSEIVGYHTSGELTGDWGQSVSYAGVTFSGEWKDPDGRTFQTRSIENNLLITIAKSAVERAFSGNFIPEAADSPLFSQHRAAFVTLKKEGQLRGCIGSVFASRPLSDEVQFQAVNAALHDTRFTPVTPEEFKILDIEISILSPIWRCDRLSDIRLGIHGIILKKGRHQALYLPQVAIEQGWDLNTTLSSLSEKAGLDPEAWRTNTELYLFEVDRFERRLY
ncbi:AmmeMemoRadiSam system protein B [bacterium]|nr:AmmeMemoRadiSam system protein B [bacterium]